ncbi:MAG: isoprenylcysteine carboxylmethyltransferase family protein [Verrucomicrobiota bacterium]
MMLLIRVGGICLWVAPMIYVFAPRAVVWSKMGLPDWVRIVGMVLGVLMLGAIWSLYVSIGKNVSATGSTRRHHELITNGPYQWIRHPLYTFGVILFFGLGLTADSWFIIVLGVFAFLLMAARIPREEANLIAAFGSDYERYREKTGKFLPRFRVRS